MPDAGAPYGSAATLEEYLLKPKLISDHVLGEKWGTIFGINYEKWSTIHF